MKTLFERLKPQNKSKVLDFVFKYPATGESLLKDLNNIYIVNLKYGMAIELNRICNYDSTFSFSSISNLFEE
jgi:hypothetical protein